MTSRYVRLGEVLELTRDLVDIDPVRKYGRLGLYSFGKGVIHHPPVSGDQVGKLRFYRVRPHELVFSNQMAWEGAIAVTTERDTELIASNRFLTYAPRRAGVVDVSYLRWLLLSEPGMRLVQKGSPGSIGRNRTLGIKAFEAIDVPLPPIDEQRRVAGRLSMADATIEACKKRLEHQTEVGGALISSLVHRADLSDRERRARGWRQVSVGDVLHENIDAVPVKIGANYPMAGVYSFGRGLFSKPTVVGGETSYMKYHRLHTDQIVLSRLKGWEGAIARVHPCHDGRHASTEFPTFAVNHDRATPTFVEYLMASEPFWARLKLATRGVGARRERVKADRFLGQSMWLPPKAYQVGVGSLVAGVDRLRDDDVRTDLLDGLMPSLLNRAFGHVG